MPDPQFLYQLLSSIDGKTLTLLRYYELQIDFLRRRLKGRLLPDQAERAALGRLAMELGRPELAGRANLFHPETLFRWHRELIAAKFDGSAQRGPGRPSPWRSLQALVLRMAQDNPCWGAPRIHGQLKALGYGVSEPTVWRMMERLGLDPDPKKGTRWSDFLRRNREAIVAADFFTVETWTGKRLATQHCLFLIQHDTRQVHLAGITEHPTAAWMDQVARNLTMDNEPFLQGRKLLILDRDTKFCKSFRTILADAGVRPLILPRWSPNLNAIAERWVRSVKEECLRELPLLPGPLSLRKVLDHYLEHYHRERAHQGLGNTIPFPAESAPATPAGLIDQVQRKSRLGGLLNYYCWPGDFRAARAA